MVWVSVALAVIAAASLFFTGRASMAAVAQTKIQREIREAAAQPYVWVDLRPDDAQAALLLLVVGNSGPTVATNVRVKFDPRPEVNRGSTTQEPAAFVLNQLEGTGIASVGPGRTVIFGMGLAHEAITNAVQLRGQFAVTVTADGPFGPLEPNNYWIDLAILAEARAVGDGSMRLIEKSIDKLGEKLKS